jgi:class 3 adenylate cyclase
MSEIDPRAEMPLVDWSELGVSGLLPTGTVTLLLADVEGSTRLWETQPEDDRSHRAAESDGLRSHRRPRRRAARRTG